MEELEAQSGVNVAQIAGHGEQAVQTERPGCSRLRVEQRARDAAQVAPKSNA